MGDQRGTVMSVAVRVSGGGKHGTKIFAEDTH